MSTTYWLESASIDWYVILKLPVTQKADLLVWDIFKNQLLPWFIYDSLWDICIFHCLVDLEYADFIPCRQIRWSSQKKKKMCVLGMTLNCIWWWGSSSGECGVLLRCHYSQVHSNTEWLYSLRFHLWVKWICLKNYLYLIGILDAI